MTPTAHTFPPGPRMPLPLQTAAMLLRMRPFLERSRRRYGNLFRLRVSGFGNVVIVADPPLIKQVFTASPEVLHAGDRSPLRRVLGDFSLLAIDEDLHMEQRKLLLPPFKGQRMKAYESLIEEITRDELATWPEGVAFPVAESMQRITLRAILRAVFGAKGRELHELEALMPPWTTLGSRLANLPILQKDLGPRSPWGRFLRLRHRIDVVLDRLIADAKADPALEDRVDVLALLVQARHTDGTEMTAPEIRDQLVTMLAAGHETTAHTLSWAVERLSRHPEALERLVAEVDAGDSTDVLDATIREVQRTRPVIFFAGRFAMVDYELGGHLLPRGTLMMQAAALTHFDPALFPNPDRFDPERFLGVTPGTYSWIPFGGGRRRCIGATFAHMELQVVLRVLLDELELVPTTAPGEDWNYRGVAVAPGRGGLVTVRRRVRGRAAADTALPAAA